MNGSDFVKFSFDEVKVTVLEIIRSLLAIRENIAFDVLIIFAVHSVLVLEQHIEIILFIIKLLVLETIPVHIHNYFYEKIKNTGIVFEKSFGKSSQIVDFLL